MPTPPEYSGARLKKSVATLLSLFLVLFCADAVVSVADDALLLLFGANTLTLFRGVLSLPVLAMAVVVYLLIGIMPMIPKRVVLPLVMFNLAAFLALIPLTIYDFDRIQHWALVISLCQAVVGFGLLFWVQRGWRFRWPIVPEERVGDRKFSWPRLAGFLAANVLVLAPGILVYLALCASLAVDHLSGGFLALTTDSLSVRARTYTRADGRTIDLIPMMHIGEAGFYRQVSDSFPEDAVILLEGVSDRRNLIKKQLDYSRMANSLGLAEQQRNFGTGRGKPRPADVDVEQFSPETIAFLNLATRVHSEGFTFRIVQELSSHSQGPEDLERLWDDLLTLRNDHLMNQIRAALAEGEDVVVPWGAAHMPGIAREIEQAGFKLAESKEYPIVRFLERAARKR